MKCFLVSLMAGSIALVAMLQERAIARSVPKPSAEGLQYLDRQIRQPILKNAQLKDPAALEKIRQYRKAWSKKYPSIAPLLGDWSDGIEGGFGIYPSSKPGQVCVMPPFSARIQSGFIEGNTISFYEGNRGDDAMSIIYNLGREKVMGVKFSENPDSRLVPFFAYPPAVSSSPRGKMFEAQGCQVAPPETQVADGRSPQNENGSDIYPSASAIQAALEAARTKRKTCFSNDPRGRSCVPSIDTIPKTDQTTKNAWAKVDPQVAHFLGSWYVGMEFLPHIYPSTVKGQVCVITYGDAIVFGIGRVTGKSLRYQDKAAYSMDGYADRSSELPYELNFFGNSGLLIFHSTDRPNSLNVAISTSSEIKPLDEYGNRFRNLFEAAGCTTGLPEETIAQPVKPLTPIAAASTYAYPSPAEFTQFKKTLKPSPVALSTTDRKLRQDFQAEWQKKNRAIAPYVGAWKTADNQDVYVFPSTVSQRACVVRQKDGQLEMKLAVSMTADMRFDGNTGMFRVDPMTDVVAGRSDKSEPLSALYGAIGSPEVSASVREELVQAGCVSELPRGGAIVAKKPEVKPIEVSKPIDILIRTGAGENPSANSRCSKDIGIGGSFEVIGGQGEGKLKPELTQPGINQVKRCIFFEEIGKPTGLKDLGFVGPMRDKKGQIWIVTHGWNNDSKTEDIRNLAQKIRAVVPPTDRVLMLDWSEAAINDQLGKAASWISPVAEASVQKLRTLGIEDDYALQNLNLVGHSLGTLMSSQIGLKYKDVNKHGVKSIIALDPPSELMKLAEYKINGYDQNAKIGQFQNSSPFTRAFVGSRSAAGNQDLTKTAHESIQFSFGNVFDLGEEHGLVVKAFAKLISLPVFRKPNSDGNLFSLEDFGSNFIRKEDGYTGVIYITKELDFKSFEYTGIDGNKGLLGTSGDDLIDIKIDDKKAPYLKDILVYNGGLGRDVYKISICNQNNISITDPDGNTVIDLDTSLVAVGNGKLLASVEISGSKIVFYGSRLGLINSPKFRCEIQFRGQGTVRAKGIGEWQINSK
jgi:pimeloyl-ACP methyl ester carboxylesterase